MHALVPMIEVFPPERAPSDLLWSDVVRHGMATPLAIARGCVDHLRQEPSTLTEGDRYQIFEVLDRAVAALERLSGNLRSDARLENPGLQGEFEDISVEELLRDVTSDLAGIAAQRQVQLLLKDESDPSVPLSGSPLLVRQALENLMTNAIKHSPRGFPVEVTCREEDNQLLFEVTDHGDGVAPSARGQIFERFGGVGPASGGLTGLGIGLSIVKRAVEAHGGQVGLISEVGGGSTFWMSFPRRS